MCSWQALDHEHAQLAELKREVREARGLPDDLVRISAGIEDEADLLADLEQAMAKAAASI